MARGLREMLTQGLLADRNDNVFAVGWVIDEDQEFVGAVEIDVVRYVNGEATVSSAVGVHLLAVDLLYVRMWFS